MNINLLSGIIERLLTGPDRIAALISERADVSNAINSFLDIIQEREVSISGIVADRRKQDGSSVFPLAALRQAEICRMLKTDTSYQQAKNGASEAQCRLQQLDAALEKATRQNDSDNNMVALVTALISSGRGNVAEDTLKAYCQCPVGNAENAATPIVVESSNANQPSVVGSEQNPQGGTAIVKVLEARTSNASGTIRAFCEMPDGSKVAIYAKNGYGQLLQKSQGNSVKVEYNVVKKGWFAYKVEPAA